MGSEQVDNGDDAAAVQVVRYLLEGWVPSSDLTRWDHDEEPSQPLARGHRAVLLAADEEGDDDGRSSPPSPSDGYKSNG